MPFVRGLESEAAETTAADEFSLLVPRRIVQESLEVLNPRVMLAPVEEVEGLRVILLADVERISSGALFIVEAEKIDAHSQYIFNIRNLMRSDRVVDIVKLMMLEELIVVGCPVDRFLIWMKC